MHLDLTLVVAGLIVGVVVGLTGMGGGALMTPIMVLLLGIQPLAAVSSDLVAAAVMKPIGAGVHIRQHTVNWTLARWLMVGSVPSAFAGVLLLRALGGSALQNEVKTALGVALVAAFSALSVKAVLTLRARASGDAQEAGPFRVRPPTTVLIGAIGGLCVGLTSVGAGTLIIVMLLFAYPRLRVNDLVGTDLVQAIPIVASASIGHLLFGDFRFGLTAAIVVGSVPGVYVGAKLSSRAPQGIIRRALLLVLLASGLKLLGAPNLVVGVASVAFVVVGPFAWAGLRAAWGLPAFPRRGHRRAALAGSVLPADPDVAAEDGGAGPDSAAATLAAVAEPAPLAR